jgi:hypothetical protein
LFSEGAGTSVTSSNRRRILKATPRESTPRRAERIETPLYGMALQLSRSWLIRTYANWRGGGFA